jgi:hypothetical protein
MCIRDRLDRLPYAANWLKRKGVFLMKLAELFPHGGKGVIATADGDGSVNTALYARPHIIDDETLAWGMTDSRSYANLSGNPKASYLYLAPGPGYSGWRLTLELKEIRQDGELLEEIKENTARLVSPTVGASIKYLGYFRVVEVRPLV